MVLQRCTGIASNYDCNRCSCPADYDSCDIEPPPPSCLGPHAIMQATCIATFSSCNGTLSYRNVTSTATWTSSNTSVATFDTTTMGLLRAHAAGTAKMTATYDGYTYQWDPMAGECDATPNSSSYTCPISVNDSGCPDHLVVLGDKDNPIHCSSGLSCAQRLVTYGVVDANNIGVSGVTVLEDIFSTTSSTCSPPLLPTEAPPSYRPDGTFTDGLLVRCPNNLPADCGFTLSASWLFVTPSSPPFSAAPILGTLNNEVVHSPYTTVLGYTLDKGTKCPHIPLGTYVYADGHAVISGNPSCP